MRVTGVMVLLTLFAGSQAAAGDLKHQQPFNAKPRTVASLKLANARVEMMAVTRRARADTVRRRAHLDESRNMAKVMPGYPQPAFVSVDFRVKF
ncbi:hypothetical protein [Hyphococcus sp.]|uniref:hypothetical protein n=1 Tax=Hyphococcus sp. TaxID=2038636 RepID=UPI003CCC1DC2